MSKERTVETTTITNTINYAELAAMANKEENVVYQVGEDAYVLVPTEIYLTCDLINGEWVKNETKAQKYEEERVRNNEETKSRLLSEAKDKIEILKYKIELERATEKDIDELRLWKIYLLDLMDINSSDNPCTFPERPTLTKQKQATKNI